MEDEDADGDATEGRQVNDRQRYYQEQLELLRRKERRTAKSMVAISSAFAVLNLVGMVVNAVCAIRFGSLLSLAIFAANAFAGIVTSLSARYWFGILRAKS